MITHPTHHALTQALVEWYQVALGLEEKILWNSNKPPPYIQSVWLADLVNFLQDNDIRIATKQYLTSSPQRRNDHCFELEILNRKLQPVQLIQLNTCRIYLQVSHLSDIFMQMVVR